MPTHSPASSPLSDATATDAARAEARQALRDSRNMAAVLVRESGRSMPWPERTRWETALLAVYYAERNGCLLPPTYRAALRDMLDPAAEQAFDAEADRLWALFRDVPFQDVAAVYHHARQEVYARAPDAGDALTVSREWLTDYLVVQRAIEEDIRQVAVVHPVGRLGAALATRSSGDPSAADAALALLSDGVPVPPASAAAADAADRRREWAAAAATLATLVARVRADAAPAPYPMPAARAPAAVPAGEPTPIGLLPDPYIGAVRPDAPHPMFVPAPDLPPSERRSSDAR